MAAHTICTETCPLHAELNRDTGVMSPGLTAGAIFPRQGKELKNCRGLPSRRSVVGCLEGNEIHYNIIYNL